MSSWYYLTFLRILGPIANDPGLTPHASKLRCEDTYRTGLSPTTYWVKNLSKMSPMNHVWYFSQCLFGYFRYPVVPIRNCHLKGRDHPFRKESQEGYAPLRGSKTTELRVPGEPLYCDRRAGIHDPHCRNSRPAEAKRLDSSRHVSNPHTRE